MSKLRGKGGGGREKGEIILCMERKNLTEEREGVVGEKKRKSWVCGEKISPQILHEEWRNPAHREKGVFSEGRKGGSKS